MTSSDGAELEASPLAPSGLASGLLESTMPDDPASSEIQREQARQLAEHHYYAALDLVLEGHHDQAVEEYRRAVAADPKFTDALHGLSRALQDLNRFDEAIAVAQQISEIDPDDILAHTSLSILYQKKGMVPEAEAEGNRARVLGWKEQLKKKE
jgi:tetratricopeptide (TPR) repeat protein